MKKIIFRDKETNEVIRVEDYNHYLSVLETDTAVEELLAEYNNNEPFFYGEICADDEYTDGNEIEPQHREDKQ